MEDLAMLVLIAASAAVLILYVAGCRWLAR